jgi:hypothetical protein
MRFHRVLLRNGRSVEKPDTKKANSCLSFSKTVWVYRKQRCFFELGVVAQSCPEFGVNDHSEFGSITDSRVFGQYCLTAS